MAALFDANLLGRNSLSDIQTLSPVDEFGTIYLVAEDSGTPNSRLFVLSAVGAVPEPETYAQMLGGLGVMAWVARRRKAGTRAQRLTSAGTGARSCG